MHGTGTALGDPIEIGAISAVLSGALLLEAPSSHHHTRTQLCQRICHSLIGICPNLCQMSYALCTENC